MSHFDFLKAEFATLHDPAVQAERFALSDPRTACFHARRALELTVDWLYTHDRTLNPPLPGPAQRPHPRAHLSRAGRARVVQPGSSPASR